jgi:hypothetical protein
MKRVKDVTIWVDEDRDIQVDPDPVDTSAKKAEQVEWTCYQGEFEIDFKEDVAPFPSKNFKGGQGGSITSGPTEKKKVRERQYKYNVIVTVTMANGDKKRRHKDPGVVVED